MQLQLAKPETHTPQPTTMIYALYQYFTNMPSWQLLTGFFLGYVGYYLMQVVKVSTIMYSLSIHLLLLLSMN